MAVISFEEFKKADLRVGKILSAERVEGSPKLLKLKVNLGSEPDGLGERQIRQILSGIGKVYTPEELVGKNVAIVANLEPRVIMGLDSQGMVLAASGTNGPVVVFLQDDVAPGSLIT